MDAAFTSIFPANTFSNQLHKIVASPAVNPIIQRYWELFSEVTMAEAFQGVVKWFNDAKGFGFIEHENGKDVFVHYSVIESDGFKTLKDGEPVEYEIEQGDKGLHATRVARASKSAREQIEVEATGAVEGNSASTSQEEGLAESSEEIVNN